ncbi:MAG: hypothetical protein ACR2MG_13470 [Pyrinomonadaceae bacterium]
MKNGISQFLTVVSFCVVILTSAPRIYGQQTNNNLQNQPTKIVRSYRLETPITINELKNFLPAGNAWVEDAVNRSMGLGIQSESTKITFAKQQT